MGDINSVILSGRVCGENNTHFGYTSSGLAKLDFTIAVNRNVKKGDKWESIGNFFQVFIYGTRAESVHKKLAKGKQVVVRGRLVQSTWEKDGQKHSKINISADEVQFSYEGKKEDKDFTEKEMQDTTIKQSAGYNTESTELFAEDIPF